MPMNDRLSEAERTIRMWYFRRVDNIGDIVSPNVVAHVANSHTRLSSEGEHLAIGSILAGATARTVVWGTGVMDGAQDLSRLVPSNIYAVRGKLTHKAVKAAGISVGDIPLGDPGVFAPELFPHRVANKYRIGLIPHYVDRPHPWLVKSAQEEGVIVLNVHDKPADFFTALRSCTTILSSSLHGLIFAESVGLPNLWIKLSDRVVGSGYKFRDWFSLADTPQNDPHEPKDNETAAELSKRATIHNVNIDRKGLASSFPRARLEALSDEIKGRTFLWLSTCRRRPLPVFIISYNRGSFLRRAVESYRRLNRKLHIIVHDNGSTDEETRDVLRQLRGEDCLVFHRGRIHSVDDLNLVNETVQEYFSDWAEPSRYIVTDCDVDLSIAATNAIDVYDELLNRFTGVQCVGPMLRIRDIPKTYPLFNKVMNSHIQQFWHREPEWIETSFGPVASIECDIDTTFALHRANEPFHRLKKARRVYHPFEAEHLDWQHTQESYLSSYFEMSSAEISHWNNKENHEKHFAEMLAYKEFRYVDEYRGRLVTKTYLLNN